MWLLATSDTDRCIKQAPWGPNGHPPSRSPASSRVAIGPMEGRLNRMTGLDYFTFVVLILLTGAGLASGRA